MKTGHIQQKVKINAEPIDVYNALTDSKTHSEITKMKATNNVQVGGIFEQCDGHHKGYYLLLEPGKRIIQAWYNVDFPNNHFSIADFKFEKTKEGTKLIFNHYAVPKDSIKQLEVGWKKIYWNPLKDYLEKKNESKKAPVNKTATAKKVVKKATPAKKAATKTAVKKSVKKPASKSSN
ncbi:MAG TPA: SRPBCC domain-containing protein [Flavipsychrobacter sp.]|nr:SRPBCC domain-containing protein [Flavipsychrobacter sp.]